jgi:hypothetical protein
MPNVVVNRRGAYAASVPNRWLGFVLVASRRSHIWRIWGTLVQMQPKHTSAIHPEDRWWQHTD